VFGVYEISPLRKAFSTASDLRIYHNVQLQASFAYGFRENMAGGHAGLRFGF
jgi:hypothetical protein